MVGEGEVKKFRKCSFLKIGLLNEFSDPYYPDILLILK